MNGNKDLLFAVMHANSEKAKGDFTGNQFREEQKEHAAVPHGSGGGGGTGDWNDLKNRPFYEETEEVTKTFVGLRFDYNMTTLRGLQLIVGTTYYVSLDGTEYSGVCVESLEGAEKGVPLLKNSDANVFLAGASGQEVIMLAEGIDKPTEIVIRYQVKNIKPLDQKFLPEALQFGEQHTELPILAETEVTTVESGGIYGSENLFGFQMADGRKYKVNCNGTEYLCTAKTYDEAVIANGESVVLVGDAVLAGERVESTGEPFCVVYIERASGSGFFAQKAATYTISVSEMIEELETIDPKYLPDGVGGGVFWVTFSTEDNTTYTSDKTHSEIEAAYKAGKNVRFARITPDDSSVFGELAGYVNSLGAYSFQYINPTPNGLVAHMHIVMPDNSVTTTAMSYPITPTT